MTEKPAPAAIRQESSPVYQETTGHDPRYDPYNALLAPGHSHLEPALASTNFEIAIRTVASCPMCAELVTRV